MTQAAEFPALKKLTFSLILILSRLITSYLGDPPSLFPSHTNYGRETLRRPWRAALRRRPVPDRNSPTHASEQQIDPWSVKAATDEQGNALAFDCEAISQKWNTKLIDKGLLECFERVTGHRPHRWLRRGLFFSHRDFNLILDYYEQGKGFFLYTGRGPSAGTRYLLNSRGCNALGGGFGTVHLRG